MPDSEFKSDHDAIITLIAEFRGFSERVTADIKEIKDNTKATLNDHEARIRSLEESALPKPDYIEAHEQLSDKVGVLYKYLYIGFGALGVLQIVIGYVLDHYGK